MILTLFCNGNGVFFLFLFFHLTLLLAMSDLSIKKCVPCNAKDLQPMTEEAANDLIQKVCGWMSFLIPRL